MLGNTSKNRVRVLHWINLRPRKHGSFEDYVLQVHKDLKDSDLDSKFVFIEESSGSTRTLFSTAGIAEVGVGDSIDTWCTFSRVSREFKPTLVHFHFFSPLSSLYVLAKLMGIRTIVTAHLSVDNRFSPNTLNPLVFLKRFLFSRAVDTYLPVSNYIADYLRALGISPKKIRTIHNGIDIRRFHPPSPESRIAIRDEHGIADKVAICFVGQLSHFKGFDGVLELIDRLEARDYSFLIAGHGELEDDVRLSRSNVKYFGESSNTEEIFGAADIVVAPSVWQEAFGLSIAEASASEVPVIASKVGGIPEVVLHNQTGLLMSRGDPNELESTIRILAADRQLRKRLGINGRAHVVNNFNLEKVVDQVSRLYEAHKHER